MIKSNSYKKFILFSFIFALSFSKLCLNPDGESVDWWLQLIFPSNVPGGFAYFDSSYAAPSFVINQNRADSDDTPMTRTLSQINTL